MIVTKSYTRITLALDIIRRLNDGEYKGYHELNIIKHQIDLHDVITIEATNRMGISCNNPEVPVDSGNLCWQIVEIVQQKFGIREQVHITIEKNIPVKGGLAGGSANAATVLSMLNTLWKLELDREQLCSIGRTIGMDIPFYFTGGTAFDTETTGILEPIETDLLFDFVLVTPDFGVPTRDAYKNIVYKEIGKNREKTIQMKEALKSNDLDTVIASMHNDFEYSVFKRYPQLEKLRERLLQAGCLNAVMSGSGSAMIGITKDSEHAQRVQDNISAESIVVSTYCPK